MPRGPSAVIVRADNVGQQELLRATQVRVAAEVKPTFARHDT
ncbi:MAG: hypothetical protein WCB80_17755 [Mycobacterium sp.]